MSSPASSSSPSWPLSCRYFNPAVMNPAYYEGFLDRVECLDGGVTCLEVHQGQIRRRELHGSQQITAVTAASPKPDVRFFFVNDHGRYNFQSDSVSICLPKEDWRNLLHTAQVHPVFVDQIQKKFTGAFATFNTLTADDALEAFHVSIKMPSAGFLEAALYLRFENLPQKSLTGLYIGNDLEDYIRQVSAWRFQHFEHYWGLSILVPILRQQSQTLRARNKHFGHNIAVMERDLQRGSQGAARSATDGPQRPTEQFLNMTHQCAGNERVFLGALDFHAELTGFVRSEFLNLVQWQRPRSHASAAMTRDDRDFAEALQAHQNFTIWQAKSERVGGLPRAAALLNATDSLINQMDSKSSAEIAVQSTSIAEQTRQDGLTMKRIAEESKALTERTRQDGLTMKAIAEDTRRDSNAMRAIAILTMFYLPTSTVATVCGTVFVNNGSTEPGVTVDRTIWVFCVISVLLTVLTLTIWLFFLPGGWRSLRMVVPLRAAPVNADVSEGIQLHEGSGGST